MFGIFMESLVIFKLYTGMKLLIVLFAAAWMYLLVTEKDKKIRLLFVYAPMIILFVFLFPLSRKLFVAAGLDGATYYRVLWTIPMGMIIAYAACKLWSRHKRIGLVVTSALVILCGSYVYDSTYITKAENLYHLPDTVIRICDLIEPENENSRVTVVVPEELVHFIRQYNARINMPYGRDMIASQWDYYDEVHYAMEETEVIEMEALITATRKNYCQYLVISPSRETDQEPEDCGLVLIDTIDGYRVYEDPVTSKVVAEWEKYDEE